MSSKFLTVMQRLSGWRLWAVFSLVSILLVELVVSAMALLLSGKIASEYLLTSLVAAGFVAPLTLAIFNHLLREFAKLQQCDLEHNELYANTRLNVAIENAQMIVWELDLVSGALQYDHTKLKLLGISTDSAPRDIKGWIELLSPDDRTILAEAFHASLQEGAAPFDLEYRYALHTGQSGWAHSTGKVTQRDSAGNPLVALGSTLNVTARKQAEIKLQQSEILLRSAMESIDEGILMVAQDGRVLSANKRFMEIWRVPQALVENGQDDLLLAHVLEQLVDPDGFLSLVKRLYEHDDEARDTLHFKDGRVFSRYTRALFIGKERGRIWCFKDITEQSHAQSALAEREEIFRSIVTQANEGIVLINSDTQDFVEFNDTACKTLGYSREEFAKLTIADIQGVMNPSVIAKNLRAILVNGAAEFETLHRHKNGTLRHVRVSSQALHILGHQYVAAIITDITERKQMERTLADSNNLLMAIIDTAPVRIFWKNSELRYLGCNSSFATDAGVASPNDVIGKSDYQLGWKAQADLYRADDKQVMESGISKLSYDEPQTTPDGNLIWLRTSKVPLLNEVNETIGVLGIYEDVTRQKRTEEALLASEQKLLTILDSVDAYIYLKDKEGRYLFANRLMCELWHAKMEGIVGCDDDKFFNSVTAENIRRDDRRVLDDGEIIKSEEPNVVLSNGKTATFLSTKLPLRLEDGTIYALCGISTDITERKKSEEVIWSQANFDYLTNLPNRRMFRDRLAQDLKKAHRAGLKLALLFLDLDHFKEVNDTLGHDLGDTLLVEAAQRIGACVRGSDTVARLGGDEFTIILADLEETSSVERIAEDIIRSLNEPFNLDGDYAYVSASIGITLYPDDATEIEELLKNADQSMFESKRAGRNRFSYFTNAMQRAAQHRLQIVSDLRIALVEGQFQLHYQPIVDLRTGAVHKAEALLRWVHPTRGIISPAEFIPLAEETGLIHELGDWVFTETTAQTRHWQSIYGKDFQISVNVSPVQMQAQDNFARLFHRLKQLGLSGQNFVFEITEGLLLDTTPHVTAQLLSFRDAGIQVAIDDFGTGYSALSYLKKLDIDYLKIDQSFIHNLTAESSDMALCEAIVVMAHKLGLKVIAEGVETHEQNELLNGIGCDYVQGYFHSKPLPAKQFEVFLHRSR